MSLFAALSTTNENQAQRAQRIGWIALSFGAALLVGILYRILELWSGELTLWPIALGGALIGLLLAWRCKAITHGRFDATIALLFALFMTLSLWDINALFARWQTVVQTPALSFSTWMGHLLSATACALLPPLAWLLFAWKRNTQPKGRLSIFFAASIGMITSHFLVGHASTTLLIFFSLYLILGGALVVWSSFLISPTARRRCITLIHLGLLVLLALSPTLRASFTWSEGKLTFNNLPEPLAFYPFAPLAANDPTLPLTPPSSAYKQAHGAYLRTNHIEETTALSLSQSLTFILQPQAHARRGLRPLVDATEAIKGQYDALWVEVPPAWQAKERDYFDEGVVKSLLKNVTETGCLIYHLDVRPLTFEALLTRAEALAVHFPYVQLWVTSTAHWQLVATRQRPQSRTLPPEIEAFCLTTDLCALKQASDRTGFRLFETWHARQHLFHPKQVDLRQAPLVQRLFETLSKTTQK